MKVLKGFILGLLSFLLFLSLIVFGIALTIKSTVLNPDFVAAEVDRIDVSLLIREITEEQIGGQLPREMEFLKEAVYDVIADFEPLIKEQLKANIYTSYDYFLGKNERLSFIVSLEPVKEGLRERLRQTFLQSLPPQLSALPPDQVEQYFDQYYEQFAEQIPLVFEYDEDALPPEVMTTIREVRQGIGYFLLGYNLLIAFMVLLVLGIILINRDIKSITRKLGVVSLTYGVFEYGGILLARYFLPAQLPMLPQIPPSLQTWLLGLLNDLWAPLETFSLVCLAGGAALIVVSFVYRLRRAEDG